MRNLLCKSNLPDKTMVIFTKKFPEIILIIFRIRTSLGLKFCNSLSIYSALPCAVKNSPVETSKNEPYRFIGKENGS
jgi:hypothetical protein